MYKSVLGLLFLWIRFKNNSSKGDFTRCLIFCYKYIGNVYKRLFIKQIRHRWRRKFVSSIDKNPSEGNWISLMNPWISRARGWEENELWGRKSISLFQTIVMYPRPNVITCTVRVWLREIGFSLTYGALMLKTWRWVSSVTTR